MKNYKLFNLINPGRDIKNSRFTLDYCQEQYSILTSPLKAINQIVIRSNNQPSSQKETVSFFIDSRKISVNYHCSNISESFAKYIASKVVDPRTSIFEKGRLDDDSFWELYYRIINGEVPRPLSNNKQIDQSYWERICNFGKLDKKTAITRLRLYRESDWLKINNTNCTNASIIVPIYGQLDHTLSCLLSIFEERRRNHFKDKINIQVIVVDDCSPLTEEIECLKEIDRQGLINLIIKENNSGFVDSCNTGAKRAIGQYIVFLNNDVEVLDHWLEELIDPLADTRVGLVGSKLIYPDGTLQEAGGIIWANGNAWNFGRGSANPYLPEFTYIRDVDYISGASISLRKKDFDKVEGFSEEFRPAYCEDSDLALKIRYNLGKLVTFNPFSQIVHYEGKSCGTDLQSGLKKYQVTNTKKLYKKWKSTLLRNNNEDATDVFYARGRTSSQKTILIIDHYIPEPDKDAGSRTMDAFIVAIKALNYHIVFWPDNLYASKYCKRYQKMGIEVMYFTEDKCPRFEEWFSAHAKYIDIALISRPACMTKYAPIIKENQSIPIIFYGHDLHHLRAKSEISALGDSNISKELNEFSQEKNAWDLASLIMYPTVDETDVVRKHLAQPEKAQTIQAYTSNTKNHLINKRTNKTDHLNHLKLLFVGGFRHTPNSDAVIWFCESIMPIISKNVTCKLSIAGSHPTNDILSLESDNISVLGFVTDEELENLYSSHDIVVVPLRYGAGIKGKVIEAFSKCVPVVTTSVGMQGIRWNKSLSYVADSAEDFASEVLNVYRDISEGSGMSDAVTTNAISFIMENFSEKSMIENWENIFKKLLPD